MEGFVCGGSGTLSDDSGEKIGRRRSDGEEEKNEQN